MAGIGHKPEGTPLLFVDPACRAPYSGQSLALGPLGGSEASLIRVAQSLPSARVMQHNRQAPARTGAVDYLPLNWGSLPSQGPVVVMRDHRFALHARSLAPDGRLFLWLHDLAGLELALAMPDLYRAGIELIAVSNFHREQIISTARATLGAAPLPTIRVIYNAIPDELALENTVFDPDRLVFLSSPHKGLNETLGMFVRLKDRHPNLELQIANPGYHPTPDLNLPGVTVLGALPHAQALNAARGALCLFYPNVSYPETFGLVLAEANAIGVPVLAHEFGATCEVLSSEGQALNAQDFEAIAARVEAWRNGARPIVSGRRDFRLSSISRQWRTLLSEAEA